MSGQRTFRFIRAEFSRSRVVGTRDLEVSSSSDVSEKISIGLLDDDEDEVLISFGGECLGAARGNVEGSGVGDGVFKVTKCERNGEGGLFRGIVLVVGEFESGELFEWRKVDLVGETGERGSEDGFEIGGIEY